MSRLDSARADCKRKWPELVLSVGMFLLWIIEPNAVAANLAHHGTFRHRSRNRLSHYLTAALRQPVTGMLDTPKNLAN
jgi:hypothetical protein